MAPILLTPIQPGTALPHEAGEVSRFGSAWHSGSGQNGPPEMHQVIRAICAIRDPLELWDSDTFLPELLLRRVRQLFPGAEPRYAAYGWWTNSPTHNPLPDRSVGWLLSTKDMEESSFADRLLRLAAQLCQEQILAVGADHRALLVPGTNLGRLLRNTPGSLLGAPDPTNPCQDEVTFPRDRLRSRLKETAERGTADGGFAPRTLPFEVTLEAENVDGGHTVPHSFLQDVVTLLLERLGIERPSCSILLDAHIDPHELKDLRIVCYATSEHARECKKLLPRGAQPLVDLTRVVPGLARLSHRWEGELRLRLTIGIRPPHAP